jgi:uncharacterized membrane protein YfcA
MNPITGLLTALGVLTAAYIGGWTRAAIAARHRPDRGQAPDTDTRFPSALQLGVGAVTNFFDTLGIGSFATTTAIFRLRRMLPDRIIPGTLNAGHTLPAITQAFIYTAVIPVDVLTLFSMIAAAVLGAWFGAGIVARWPKRKIQLGMGSALLVAAALMLVTQLQASTGSQILPIGGEALGVRGARLAAGIAGNFMLGALMTLGIGLYAPCMILVSLLGMNPRSAFPIMMGSCAFLMPVGSLRFMRERAYSLRNALGLTLGGVPAVFVAAYIVKELPLSYVRWLVIVVVVYTAVTMLLAGRATEEQGESAIEAAKA